MMCISLWQPWASLMAWGLKRNETRHWSTRYRGPLLIHAAKKWTQEQKALCMQWPFHECLADRGVLPLGNIVGKVVLMDVKRTEDVIDDELMGYESYFGNYGMGRYAWLTEKAVALPPIPWRGAQGFFDVFVGVEFPERVRELLKC